MGCFEEERVLKIEGDGTENPYPIAYPNHLNRVQEDLRALQSGKEFRFKYDF